MRLFLRRLLLRLRALLGIAPVQALPPPAIVSHPEIRGPNYEKAYRPSRSGKGLSILIRRYTGSNDTPPSPSQPMPLVAVPPDRHLRTTVKAPSQPHPIVPLRPTSEYKTVEVPAPALRDPTGRHATVKMPASGAFPVIAPPPPEREPGAPVAPIEDCNCTSDNFDENHRCRTHGTVGRLT